MKNRKHVGGRVNLHPSHRSFSWIVLWPRFSVSDLMRDVKHLVLVASAPQASMCSDHTPPSGKEF